MKTDDPLDNAFGLLRARSCEQAPCNLSLEEQMMKEFSNRNRPGVTRLAKLVAMVICIIAVTAVTEATTGAVSNLVRKTFSGFIDGQKVEIVVEKDGNALLRFPVDQEVEADDMADEGLKEKVIQFAARQDAFITDEPLEGLAVLLEQLNAEDLRFRNGLQKKIDFAVKESDMTKADGLKRELELFDFQCSITMLAVSKDAILESHKRQRMEIESLRNEINDLRKAVNSLQR